MSKKETTALATQENVNMTTVSCSFFKDLSADSEKYVPSVDDCNAMTATELHKNLTAALVGTIVCYAAAKNLVVSAKMRMQAGETVGGCLTFTGVGGYVDLYVRKPSQSLDAAVRASYRLLGGLGIDEKHDGTEARAAKKKAAEEKAKQIADKKAVKAARLALDEAAKKAKVLKDKTNIEVLAGCGKIVLSERFLPLLRDLVRVRKHLAGIFRVVGAPRVRFRAVRRHYDPDSLRGNSGGHQVSHAHQIVGRTGEGKHPIHFQRSAMPHLA
jgi:hypothetical protein